MSDLKDTLELSEVISGLRAELEKAQNEGQNKSITFGVEGIEIELDVAIAKSVEGAAQAEISMGVDDMSVLKYVVGKAEGKFSINGTGNYEKIANQKIKLILNAKDKDGSSTNLSMTR